MQRFYVFLLCVLLASLDLNAQLAYPVVGGYKSRSAQGMAIYGRYAFLFNDGGLCRMLNMETGNVDNEFLLECAAKDTHVNCACFGLDRVSNSSYPPLYITEFYGKRRCFVEIVKDKKSQLVQTIEYVDRNGKNPYVREWIVDGSNRKLYAVIREENRVGKNIIRKFNLPPLANGGPVILTGDDVLEEFTVEFVNGLQGGKIAGKYMYLVTGFSALQGNGEFYNREIKVIDLEHKAIAHSIDMRRVTMNEPEDIDFYNDKCYLFAGGTGGIYQIELPQ